MYKLIGSIMIIVSSIYFFNKKTISFYVTYKFLKEIDYNLQRLSFENNKHLTYEDLFKEFEFDYISVIERYQNIFINKTEIDFVKIFFENHGKRDNKSEEEYLKYHLDFIKNKINNYYSKYNECKKIYLISGISFGLFIIIFLI